MCCFSLVSVVS